MYTGDISVRSFDYASWNYRVLIFQQVLNFALNLLTLHRQLHLTFLLAPAAVASFEQELASPFLAHIHSGTTPAADRLELVIVKDEGVEEEQNASSAFAKAMPPFLDGLLTKLTEDTDTGAKKSRSSLIIYDVSFLAHLGGGLSVLICAGIMTKLFLGFLPPLVSKILEEHHLPSLPILGFFPVPAAACY